ncbi:hypothetical protein E6C67_36830 (plasmid) [Azospirillum sp. TSA2s]|uniref:hypothetical protein n=1 Tax=Azospirillum sp. TSA2s TaxID=709810 RepID=UPI0010A9A250|nr:hypothetical protein [Azospirillum sp. TSA2s]QCG99343.1 hypothetical protein E6C67_36830 [Azospirillum sp. TSA2s]
MSNGSTLSETITMSQKLDENGVGRHRAVVTLSLTGTVEMGERRFEWAGLTNADNAGDLQTYARWALGRQLAQAVRDAARDTTATAEQGGWTTRVTWRGQGFPTVTVTIDGFTDFLVAAATARRVVDELVETMVPAATDPLRQQLARLAMPNIPEWFHPVHANPLAFP